MNVENVKKEVSSEAKTCPHCGAVPAKKSNKKSALILFILICISIPFLYSITDNSPSSSYALESQCKELVTWLLKSPSTADFSNVYASVATVRGAVDSQNGFGAMVRSQFSCEFDIDESTKQPKLKTICFDGKDLLGEACY